jgi:hypothetical protein
MEEDLVDNLKNVWLRIGRRSGEWLEEDLLDG